MNAGKNLRLGVNIDHVATVRNARGSSYPNPVRAALISQEAGADGITAHLREDRRHIVDQDIASIIEAINIPLNFEMAATDEMQKLALDHTPHAVCIVPEKREERTTEGGLDVISNHNKLKPIIDRLREIGVRTTLFIDPEDINLDACYDLKIDCAEIHCGTLCRLYEEKDKKDFDIEFNKIKNFSKKLFSNGIEAHAGHGLNYETTKLISSINEIEELNIGFFIIAESIFNGLDKTILTIKESMTIGRSLEE